MTSGAPKRSLFSKPSWATTTAPVAKTDDDAIFGRSQIYEDIIAEQKKRKEKHAAKAKARRGSNGHDAKRRRISEENADSSDSDVGTNRSEESQKENVEGAGPVTRSTPTKRKITAALDSPVKPKIPTLHAQTTSILLDDDDDFEITATGTAVKPTKHSTKQRPLVDDLDSDPESEDDDDYTRDLKRRARERAFSQRQAATARMPLTEPSESMTESLELTQENPAAEGEQSRNEGRKVRILITTIYPNIKPLIITYSASKPLGAVREAWCIKNGFSGEKANTFFLVSVSNGARFFDSSNLMKTLELLKRKRPDEEDPSKGKIHLEAMNAEIWEHRRAQKEREEAEATGPGDQDAEAAPEEPAPPPEPRLIIKLRAEGQDTMQMRVRPSTRIGKIMGGCGQLMNVEEGRTCFLYVDGERLEPNMTVQDAEIEGGDIVEVMIV